MLRKLLIIVCLISTLSSSAQLAGDPDDPDFIHAYLMVASPGPALYQVGGHTFIRMQCPAADLDYCFTFENEEARGLTQLFKRVNGRFISFPTDEYLSDFTDRQVVSLPLLLKPREKQRLWQVLDSLTATPMHPFNIRKESCSGHILRALNISLRPSSIKALGSDIIGTHNGEIVEYALGGEGPWRTDIIRMGLGNEADDKDRLYNHAFPIIIASEWHNFYIVSPDGTPRPLLAAPDIVLHPKERHHFRSFTPVVAASLLLAISLIVVALGFFGSRLQLPLRILRVLYSILFAVGFILLTIICASPSAIGGWDNLNFMLLNPLPLLFLYPHPLKPWQTKLRYGLILLWIVYAFTPLITWSVPPAMSILAVAASITFLKK